MKFAVGPLFNSVRRWSFKIILQPAVSVEHGNHGNEVGHTHEDHVVPEIKIRDVKKITFFLPGMKNAIFGMPFIF